jgi:DNA repair protein SbcC/Rad50
LGALDLEISSARAARVRRDDAFTAERAARAKLDEARHHASKAKEAFDQRKQAQLDLESEIRNIRSDMDQMARQLDRALTGICHWPDLPDGELWLAETCRQWREAASAAETAALRIAEAEALVSDKMIAARSGQDRLDEARKGQEAAQADADARAQERSSLLGGEAVAEVTARLQREAQALETAHSAARSALAEANAARSAAEAKVQQVESEMAAASEHIAADAAALAAELEAAVIEETEVAKAAAAGSAALDAEADALAEIERAANSAALLLEERREDLARHQADDVPDLLGDVLADALIAARASVEAADREVRNLELRLREDDAVRTRTAALRAELEAANAEAAVWLTLDGLIGDATGKKFRNIAQGLTLDRLLVHANARLADLKPRYSLARGTGGDMIIEVIDNDMAGQVRGLHNLSGGERFLVSLALALGLAEMSTARGMRIESLFIDEGFGALDPESLGQALALLEHLHAGGRRVGVISHVEELKERIAAKVEVTPTGRGTSKVRVLVSG